MQLVMRRYSTDETWNFRINARMVTTSEEEGLIGKYKLKQVALTEGNRRRDKMIATAIALPLAILILYGGSFHPEVNYRLSRLHPVELFFVAAGIFIILVYIIYSQIREEIRVNDLLTGRDFRARSFIGLLLKEQEIRKISNAFAIVITSARTWEEPEVIELQPIPVLTVLEEANEAA